MQIRRGFPLDVKADKVSISPFVLLPCYEPIRLEKEGYKFLRIVLKLENETYFPIRSTKAVLD